MKQDAVCILLRGKRVVAKLDGKVQFPGGKIDSDKAQDELMAHIKTQCGVTSTRPILITQLSSGQAVYLAYVNTKKEVTAGRQAKWDEESIAGHYADVVQKKLQEDTKPDLLTDVMIVALKMLQFVFKKQQKPKPKDLAVSMASMFVNV